MINCQFANMTLSFEMNAQGEQSDMHINETQSVFWDSVDIAYSILEVCLMVFICGGNLLVLIVIRRNISMHTYNNYFISQLSVADILVGICMPLNVASHKHR